MSNKSHHLDLPNESSPKGLLFLPNASPGSSLDEVQAYGGNPAILSPPGLFPMSPSGLMDLNDGNLPTLSVSFVDHEAGTHFHMPSGSDARNKWPYRLFTASPPTSADLPGSIASFRLPRGQQELEESQDPSRYPTSDPLPTFLSRLRPINARIYENCRGNRPNLWPDIAKEILYLQDGYGDLIVPVAPPEVEPRYRCGICLHPNTTTRIHTTAKRRWDCSPDILSHGPRHIKPWYSDCGKNFPRDRERRRHAQSCVECKRIQEQPLQMESPSTFNPMLSPIPPFPTENTTPQEIVIPTSPSINRGPGGYSIPMMYHQAPFAPLEDWCPQQSAGPQRTYHTSPGGSRELRSPHPYGGHPQNRAPPMHAAPRNNVNDQTFVPLSPYGDGTGPLLPQYNWPGPPGQDPRRQSRNKKNYEPGNPRQPSHEKNYEQVCFSSSLPELPSEKSKDVVARRTPKSYSHSFTVAVLILLGVSALVWFFVRFFLYP